MYNCVKISTKNSFLRKLFLQMLLGVSITGGIAVYSIMNTELLDLITRKFFLILIAQLALSFVLSFSMKKLTSFEALIIFFAYSILNGCLISGVMIIYSLNSIFYAFIATSFIFVSMVLYGLFTKEDLSTYSTFFKVGLISLILVSVFNIFVGSSNIQWLTSVFSIVLFTGLIAYDINIMVQLFEQELASEENINKLAIIGALSLYVDFINIFLGVLRGFGNKRNN